MLLVADIGGTKTDLAVCSTAAGPRAPVTQATLLSADYDDLETLLRPFLQQAGLPVSSACLAIAGPVFGRRASVTNLPWTIDADQLLHALDLHSVHLLNDLEAVAYALPILEEEDLCTLSVGDKEPCGSIAVIAPGTGLGEAFLTWEGIRYRAHASEGGHADFAPTDARQVGLLNHLLSTWDHVSYERVCSGIGLPNIYDYLRDSQAAHEPEWLARELAGATDRTPTIVRAALDEQDPCLLCRLALDTFVAILGAEAGNLALKVLATGGVYLGGGIPPRILPALRDEDRFLRAFRNKGRFSNLLTRIPVHVIVNPQAALLGAARYALDIAGE
jgi:glucokinase